MKKLDPIDKAWLIAAEIGVGVFVVLLIITALFIN